MSVHLSFFSQPVFVITTGKQTSDEGVYTPLDIASSRLQSKGAAVFVLGIGDDVDATELSQIASGPKNVFTVDSFNDLDRKADETKRGICILGKIYAIYFYFLEEIRYLFETLSLKYSDNHLLALLLTYFCLLLVPTPSVTPTPTPTPGGKECLYILVLSLSCIRLCHK